MEQISLLWQAGGRLSLSIREVDQATGEDLMPGRGHEASAKLADELKSNPSGPANGRMSNPVHPGMTQERLKAMEAEEEVRILFVHWTGSIVDSEALCPFLCHCPYDIRMPRHTRYWPGGDRSKPRP